MNDEFSVYLFFPDGSYTEEARFVSAEAALSLAKAITERKPAQLLGLIERVIITDGGDHTVFEWKPGLGVTFPPRVENN